jgi:alkaline phosphatase D
MKPLFILFLLHLPCHAMGFANGVKIGEVTDTSAVLWARLTENPEATHRVAEWKPEAPNWKVPGKSGEIRFSISEVGKASAARITPWQPAVAENDFTSQQTLDGLSPSTRYTFEVQARSEGVEPVSMKGFFSTAPSAHADAEITFTVSTCQEFELRDDLDHGHRIYRSMLALNPAFFIQSGDTLYYDRKPPLAKNMEIARYQWGRMYSLPFQKSFHQRIPSYWMHDDHDLLKNDAWPGQTYGELTWEQGIKIWREQIPQSDKPYRTFRWGKDLQIWLPEGREFRSPNTMEDGPNKSILGKTQWKWLEETMRASDATFKLYISATPVVGPDRDGKNDNHANNGFHHEGGRLRKFLNTIPGCFVINGDRHWQYHSKDPETGINEFGCGPASDAHAQGWNPNDIRPEHRFLRVGGGFGSIKIDGDKATFTHHDVDGKEVYSTQISAVRK